MRNIIKKHKTASEMRLIRHSASAPTGHCSTAWDTVWSSYIQLWHYCPHFARLMTLAHTLLRIMWINAPLISFLMLQLQAGAHVFTLLIMGERWYAPETDFDSSLTRIRDTHSKNSNHAADCLVDWWATYPGWQGCRHTFLLAVLSGEGAPFYSGLFNSRTGQAS